MTIWEVYFDDPLESHRNYTVGWYEDRDDAMQAFRDECKAKYQDPAERLNFGDDIGVYMTEIEVTPSSKRLAA